MTTPPPGARTWPDDVEVDPISQSGLDGYARARQQLARFQVPQLVGADKPHSRMFVASFDGTGNDKYADPERMTNIGILDDQIKEAHSRSVGRGYASGVGSSPDWTSQNLDGGLGYSYGPRMEDMYLQFIEQAHDWKKQDPNADISLLSAGFSRGAVTAAMFTRMVEERGIQNPDGMKIDRDAEGRILKLTPTKPDLVAPGQIRQAVVLLDPVATGLMNMKDVRLPSSVVSGLQITANNEYRDEFYGKQIIDPGMSKDGRFLNLAVDGAHCDVGGSYLLNGLATRTFNMTSAYVNSLSDTPFLQQRIVPSAPGMNVIHHSEQHRDFYSTLLADRLGRRFQVEELAGLNPTFDRLDQAPAKQSLMQGLQYRPVSVPPEQLDPTLPEWLEKGPPIPQPGPPHIDSWTPMFLNAPMSSREPSGVPRAQTPADSAEPGGLWNPLFIAATNAALRGDASGIATAGQTYAASDTGQQWLQQGVALNQQLAQQAELERQTQLQAQVLAQQNPTQNAPVMRIG